MGILSFEILSCGILSMSIFSCEFLSGYRCTLSRRPWHSTNKAVVGGKGRAM